MKRFLLLMVLCAAISTGANAQINMLAVNNNNTSCDVYFVVYGVEAGGGCTATHSSNTLLSLPPTGSIPPSDPSTFPGFLNCFAGSPPCGAVLLGPADDFLYAEIYNGDPNCGGTPVGFVGEVCTGQPTSIVYPAYTGGGCAGCGMVTATWSGGTLTFN